MKDIRLTAKALELAMEVVSDIQSKENPSFAYMVTRVQDALLQGIGVEASEPDPKKALNRFMIQANNRTGSLLIRVYPYTLCGEYPIVGKSEDVFRFIEDMQHVTKQHLWKIDIKFKQAAVSSGKYRFVLDIPDSANVSPILQLQSMLNLRQWDLFSYRDMEDRPRFDITTPGGETYTLGVSHTGAKALDEFVQDFYSGDGSLWLVNPESFTIHREGVSVMLIPSSEKAKGALHELSDFLKKQTDKGV